jgi:hypothetical protein
MLCLPVNVTFVLSKTTYYSINDVTFAEEVRFDQQGCTVASFVSSFTYTYKQLRLAVRGGFWSNKTDHSLARASKITLVTS